MASRIAQQREANRRYRSMAEGNKTGAMRKYMIEEGVSEEMQRAGEQMHERALVGWGMELDQQYADSWEEIRVEEHIRMGCGFRAHEEGMQERGFEIDTIEALRAIAYMERQLGYDSDGWGSMGMYEGFGKAVKTAMEGFQKDMYTGAMPVTAVVVREWEETKVKRSEWMYQEADRDRNAEKYWVQVMLDLYNAVDASGRVLNIRPWSIEIARYIQMYMIYEKKMDVPQIEIVDIEYGECAMLEGDEKETPITFVLDRGGGNMQRGVNHCKLWGKVDTIGMTTMRESTWQEQWYGDTEEESSGGRDAGQKTRAVDAGKQMEDQEKGKESSVWGGEQGRRTIRMVEDQSWECRERAIQIEQQNPTQGI